MGQPTETAMYDQFASDYDRFVNWHNRLAGELPFITKTLTGLGKEPASALEVLDAACGTGMHALALAKAGYTVCGADFSGAMIQAARANAQTAGLTTRFETAGFGALATTFGKQKFDALLCLGNSLPHLLTTADLSAALADFYTCLRPGGLLLLQNRNFDAVMAKKERWMEPQPHREGDAEWVFQRFYDFEPDGTIQFNIVNLKRAGDDPWQARVMSTRLRPQLSADLQAQLSAAGFGQIEAIGSLGGEPFDPASSGNLVIIARKP
jgi:2-polyprenyl-3-methyl-5-hydroxy-6-metoxy-1,4-benzoquinol methylase